MRNRTQYCIKKAVRSLKDYEEALLRSKQSPQTLAVESHCDVCKTYVWAIVDVIEYLDAVSLPTDDPLKKNCPTCGKDCGSKNTPQLNFRNRKWLFFSFSQFHLIIYWTDH